MSGGRSHTSHPRVSTRTSTMPASVRRERTEPTQRSRTNANTCTAPHQSILPGAVLPHWPVIDVGQSTAADLSNALPEASRPKNSLDSLLIVSCFEYARSSFVPSTNPTSIRHSDLPALVFFSCSIVCRHALMNSPTSPGASTDSEATTWIESAIGQPNVPAPGCAQDATVRAELSAAQNLCDQVRTSSVACDIADLLFADEDASSGNATVCDERRQRKVSRQRPSKGPAPTIRKQQHVAPVVQWQTLPLGMIPTFSCQPWPVGVAAV